MVDASSEKMVSESVLTDVKSELKAKDEQIASLTKQLEKAERQLAKTEAYSESLRNEISKLSSELHSIRSASKNSKDEGTQVSENDIQTEYGEKPMPEWKNNEHSGTLDIAESLKAVAESVLSEMSQSTTHHKGNGDQENLSQSLPGNKNNSEYVYDAASGLYYHPSTGYYWDPNNSLFYDYTTGTYYQYDEMTGEYVVHSQVGEHDSSQSNQIKESSVREPNTESGKEKTLSKGLKDETKKSRKKRKLSKRRRKSKRSSENEKILKSAVEMPETDVDVCASDMDKDMDAENQEEDCMVVEVTSEECNTLKTDKEKSERTVSSPIEIDEDSSSSCSLATGESELESGEVSSSSSSDIEIMALEKGPVQYTEGEGSSARATATGDTDDISDNYPPCIRAIVQESSCLPLGTLFMVTCMGGTIGRLKNKGHVMEIPDENVSKEHAQIKYDFENGCYKISDLGSQNGTWLNSELLSKDSGEHSLSHEDELHFCGTKLVCHIHKGSETCDDCEPGQVLAKLKAAQTVFNDHVVESKEEKERHRRGVVKKIKKKYGLERSHFENTGSALNKEEYKDAAFLRRKYVGSDVEGAKSENPASVHLPMSTANKGHKMLAKMGWKEGQGLGKNNAGIAEPINVSLRVNANAGLGSAQGASLSLDNVQQAGKAKRWTQAQKRFQDLSKEDSSQHSTPSKHGDIISIPQFSPSNTVLLLKQPSSQSTPKAKIQWHKGEVQYSDSPTNTSTPDKEISGENKSEGDNSVSAADSSKS